MSKYKSLIEKSEDPLIHILNTIVLFCVKILAVLMVIVVIWSLIDVFLHLYAQILTAFSTIFNIESLFPILGSFLAVLITIEIFMNIIFYLKEDAVHVPLVLATALTAIARKVIVIDYKTITIHYIYATAALILAVGITYWLITKKNHS